VVKISFTDGTRPYGSRKKSRSGEARRALWKKWASLPQRRGDAGKEATPGLPLVRSKCQHSEVCHKEKNHKMLEKNLPRRKHFPKKGWKEIRGVEALTTALTRQRITEW